MTKASKKGWIQTPIDALPAGNRNPEAVKRACHSAPGLFTMLFDEYLGLDTEFTKFWNNHALSK